MDVRRLARGITVCSCVMLATAPLTARADATTRTYVESQEGVNNPAVSPDGRYVAFTSNENGTSEIYVRPFPSAGTGGQWRISTKGGQHTRWAGDGRTVFYLGTDLETIHGVHVNPGPPFTVGASEIVATTSSATPWRVTVRHA